MRQPPGDGRFHEIGRQEGKRDRHVDLPNAAPLALGNAFRICVRVFSQAQRVQPNFALDLLRALHWRTADLPTPIEVQLPTILRCRRFTPPAPPGQTGLPFHPPRRVPSPPTKPQSPSTHRTPGRLPFTPPP